MKKPKHYNINKRNCVYLPFLEQKEQLRLWGCWQQVKMSAVDWIGFIGVFQILLAYTLNVSGRLENNNLTFILLNL